jgi:hypothetical protein
MKNHKLGNIVALATCLAIFGSASAQAVKHEWLDAKAARRDIARLQVDRHRAVRYHNWAKIAQDDRLIESDRLWIKKDMHKIEHAGG